MSQLNLFTGKPEETKRYLTAGKSKKIIEKNVDKLAEIMLQKGQKPEVLAATDHYILVKPKNLEDLADENLVLSFQTRNQHYKKAFIAGNLDIYSLRRHLHNQLYYDIAGAQFVIIHDKEKKTFSLYGARQSSLTYKSEFFNEAVTLILSLEKHGVDIAQVLEDVNPGRNNCITREGVKLIDAVKDNKDILAARGYRFPKKISYDEEYIKRICSIPGIKVDVSNMPEKEKALVASLLPNK